MADGQEKARISVLCSGNGSNLQALIDACQAGRIPGRIVRVTVNKKGVRALDRAAAAGIPTDYFNMYSAGFVALGEKDPARVREGRARYDAALARRVLNLDDDGGSGNDKDDDAGGARPELMVLAGWMHVLSPAFLDVVAGAGVDIINLHPALPGAYDGAGAIERAYDDFRGGRLPGNKTGIMIHHVIAEVDRGAPILTREIVIRDGETLDELTERIHGCEHELIVEATVIKAKEVLAKRK